MNTGRPLPDSSQISGSASFQSHLSTTNSQQRLRATNAYAAVTKEASSTDSPVLSNPTSFAFRTLLPFVPASIHIQDHHPSSRSWKALAFRWIVLVYCFLSFTFTSTVLYRNGTFHFSTGSGLVAPSSWEYVSSEQRLSRLSAHLSGSRAFDPYLLLASPRADAGITACLWTTDDENSLDSMVSWVARWSGPTSLVMVTKAPPRSATHQHLLQRLKTLQGHPSLTGLSLHLVHIMNNEHSPSEYLNLARLFATSPTVMLFAAHTTNLVPAQLYSGLVSQIHRPIRKPLLVTSTVTSAFSIPALTPVILPRNYELWCTERAFLGSRTSDWDDCLWQLWLEEYGLEHVNMTVPLNNEDSAGVGADDISLTRTRSRLSGKYRAEMCELALKRLSTDAPRPSKSGKRRLQWVKSFCRQTENASKNGVA